MKQFSDWIILKEKLHNNRSKAPLVKERDIWWASIGENVGSEVNGKSKLFSRPMTACLHQVRTIDYRRLSSKMGTLDTNDFARIQEGFMSLYLKRK